jgi:hypothetical protein
MDDPYRPPKSQPTDAGSFSGKPSFWRKMSEASRGKAIQWGFWERGRILHGIVLLLVSIVCILKEGSGGWHYFTQNTAMFLGHVVVANFLYTLAYAVELLAMFLILQKAMPWIRFGILIAGTLLASVFAVLSMEMILSDWAGM